MRIDTHVVKKEVEEKERRAIYSVEDIEELIVSDLQKRGLIAKDIIFKTTWEIKQDDWGGESYTVTSFWGADATIKE